MESKITTIGNYVVSTEEGVEKGFFFRSPLQKIDFDAYNYDVVGLQSAWDYAKKIENPKRKFFERLKGNGHILDNIEEWMEEDNFGGFQANILTSPIYFRRECRKLSAYSQDPKDLIQKVISYGYESPYETCSGRCEVEVTFITLRTGKVIKKVVYGEYHYTYSTIFKREVLGID